MERHSAFQVAVAAGALLAIGWLGYALVTVPQLALFVVALVSPVALLFGTLHVSHRLATRRRSTPDWSSLTDSAATTTEQLAD